MRKYVYTCDRCGKVLESVFEKSNGEESYRGTALLLMPKNVAKDMLDYDMCPDCMNAFYRFIDEGRVTETITSNSLNGYVVDAKRIKTGAITTDRTDACTLDTDYWGHNEC